jgi:MFS family permease
MMPLTLFRSPSFSGANLLTLLLYGALGGALFFVPFTLQQVHGYTAAAAGASFLPFTLIVFALSRWAGGLINRYGARLPLVVGPVVTAVGFALFALPGTGGTYWTTYFPAVVVLGIGMALVIAPLTTVVMGAAGPDRAGIASGINNAVSRAAGLIAIAVLGLAVAAVFNTALDRNVARLRLPESTRIAITSQRARLAGIQIPAGISHARRAPIKQAIDASFIDAFRMAMLVSSGLALASAGAAWIMIEPKKTASIVSRPGLVKA